MTVERWALMLLFVAGCSASPEVREAEHRAAVESVTRAAERLHQVIAAGEATPEAKAQAAEILREIRTCPGAAVIPALSRAFRDDEDEFNSVLVHLLDEYDANNLVPVRVRARVMTIESAIELAAAGATRADQADLYATRISETCSADPAALVAAWTGLLESPPILARTAGAKVDITAHVQGLAMLGVIRVARTLDLAPALKTIEGHRTTASPALFAQALIHLSGKGLKANLARWLEAPEPARTAALIAIDNLRLSAAATRRPATSSPPADTEHRAPNTGSVSAAAWVKALPDDATWERLVLAELRTLAETRSNPKPDPDGAARLARALRLLEVPPGGDPLAWLAALPPTTRIRSLERLAGIDHLARF